MNMKHTPTPWILVYGDVIRNMDGERVADCDTTALDTRPRPPIEKDKANAAFIVRACNAHGDLVAALESILVWDDGNLPGDILDDARAIVAKAKGE